MKKAIFLINMIFACCSSVLAQDDSCDEAQDFFETFQGVCKGSISAHRCIHLDVTDSYDFQGKEFSFLWNMGDGTSLEGMEVNHCYPKAGRYKATLSLLDPVTKVIIKDEAEVNVHIKGAFSLNLNLPESEVNEPVNFDYQLTFPENSYKVDKIYWYFGDDTFSCEPKPTHIYSNPGKYVARLMVKLSSDTDAEVLCKSDTIEIKLADPTQGIFKDIFNNMAISSRFLADDIQYKIMSKQGDQYTEIIDFETLTGQLDYQIIAFRGDILFVSDDISTPLNSTTNEIQQSINTNAISLAKTKPSVFSSVFFELDQDDLSKKNKKSINQNIELLETYPMLKIAIGVYTNSRGSFEKGVSLSIKRANLIKDYMLENGIDPERIEISNPNDNRALINSCLTSANCDYVDATLDRRADFKILNKIN